MKKTLSFILALQMLLALSALASYSGSLFEKRVKHETESTFDFETEAGEIELLYQINSDKFQTLENVKEVLGFGTSANGGNDQLSVPISPASEPSEGETYYALAFKTAGTLGTYSVFSRMSLNIASMTESNSITWELKDISENATVTSYDITFAQLENKINILGDYSLTIAPVGGAATDIADGLKYKVNVGASYVITLTWKSFEKDASNWEIALKPGWNLLGMKTKFDNAAWTTLKSWNPMLLMPGSNIKATSVNTDICDTFWVFNSSDEIASLVLKVYKAQFSKLVLNDGWNFVTPVSGAEDGNFKLASDAAKSVYEWNAAAQKFEQMIASEGGWTLISGIGYLIEK